MKVIAKKNRELALINAQNTQNENKAETITLVVPEEYEDYNKKIVFVTPNETVWDVITNNEYKITNAITKYDKVEFYIWLTKEVNGESIDFRTQTKPLRFYHNQDASDEITQEQINGVNTVVNLLEEEIDKVENLNLETEKVGTVTTITITKKDGTTQDVEILDGAKGDKGDRGEAGETYDDTEVKSDIADIQEEQTEQNTEIGNLQAENERLRNTLPTTTGEGQAITLNKTAELEFVKPPLPMGNSEQDGEPSLDNEAPITNVTGDVEVKIQNKNLFDISKSSLGKILNMSNGSINGGTSATDTSDYIEVNSGTTYVLKGVSSETIYYWNYYICLYDSNKDFVERQAMTSLGSKAFSFIPSQNGFIRFTYNNNSSELQLEKGSSATTYVAHKEQKFIFPLGNEKLMLGDYLADDGKQHIRKQKIFDGSESWYAYTDKNTQSYYCYYTNAPSDCIAAQEEANLVKCNVLPESTWDDIYGKRHDTPIIALRDNKRFYVRVPFATLVEWEAYITQQYTNETPVIVEYKLAQYETIPYTSAQQTAYNQIKQALSYEGQTNISSNQNAIFNVEAYLDTKEVLDNKVDKVTGKGLSTNDFTNTYKNNVDGNTSARHTHTNKSVLDIIALSDITNWNGKQNETDNSLNTTNKAITGAINEVYSIARGANQAVSYSNYQAMITAFNSLANDVYNVGQNVMIVTLNVPDLWISGIESTSVPYTYTTDEAVTTALSTNGYVQVGYYKLSALETQKVDLTNYEQNTNKTTTISSSSTNTQYPTAKAVYDYIQSLDGDEVSY